ncbi:unnamed protein product [Parnassius mnemosyne]|uniref:DDE Tnp4 domain-containing protein n=1 Tax=Parnassius mnemosyne TaxID=213953 RepID=A0AAV1LQW6_9NEOP
MPTTLNEQQETIRKFRSIANFPTVIGAIDCTHIRVKKVNADGGQLYINRKGFSSINVQVVCDADLKIMDIVTRWRGSVHDSRIFRECRLKQSKKTIVACAVLHNMAIDMREDVFSGERDSIEQYSSEPIVQRYITPSIRGNIRRRQFIETHFQ